MTHPNSGRIQPVTEDDFQRIHEIAVLGWMPIFDRYRCIVGERMWNDLWKGWERDRCLYTAETWSGRGIVTEVDGEVAGFATWWFPNDTLAEVGGNAVDPKFQCRGIGSAQIRWVLDKFRADGYRCAKVHTGMDPAHGPARAAYRNAGLRCGLTNSVYFNYLDEVAQLPVRRVLSFRWAVAADQPTVAEIARRAWAPVYDGVRQKLGDEMFGLAFPNVLERRASELAAVAAKTPEKVRIVEEDGKPLGFCILEDEEAKRLGVIQSMGVDPDAQGRAVGAGLCMDAFDLFRSRGLAYLRLHARIGEVTEATRQMCWNVGLYRELPSIDYYALL